MKKTTWRATLKTILKRLVNLPLHALGLEITRVRKAGPRTSFMPHWKERLQLARNLGFAPRVLIDGGAYQGLWSKDAAAIFPGCQVVLIEPNPSLQDTIRGNTAGILPAPILLNVALGEAPGQAGLKFRRKDSAASLLDHVMMAARKIVPVEVDTLDRICARLDLRPDLIKLDLQGSEVQALRGGTQVLSTAEMLIVEIGCLEGYIGRATPRDVLDLLYENDYSLYDIMDCIYRPYDGALASCDFIFVKNWSILKQLKGWD